MVHSSPLLPSEGRDTAEVVDAKVKKLASLVRMTNRLVVLSGKVERGEAKCLAVMEEEGMVQTWISMDTSAVPQRAGFPQHRMVEWRGSNYSLMERNKEDLVRKLAREVGDADLVLVLGDPTKGRLVEQLVTSTTEASMVGKPYLEGGSLGCVVIHPRDTHRDGASVLKVHAGGTDILPLLLSHLGLEKPVERQEVERRRVVVVPYDGVGRRSGGERLVLDLTEGQRVRLKRGEEGVVGRWGEESVEILVRKEVRHLGLWWLKEAEKGLAEVLPLINIGAKMESGQR